MKLKSTLFALAFLTVGMSHGALASASSISLSTYDLRGLLNEKDGHRMVMQNPAVILSVDNTPTKQPSMGNFDAIVNIATTAEAKELLQNCLQQARLMLLQPSPTITGYQSVNHILNIKGVGTFDSRYPNRVIFSELTSCGVSRK